MPTVQTNVASLAVVSLLPRTAILSHLSVSSPLASGALPGAALLRLGSVPCSVGRRGFVSEPELQGPATQLSDTSWASEEPAG